MLVDPADGDSNLFRNMTTICQSTLRQIPEDFSDDDDDNNNNNTCCALQHAQHKKGDAGVPDGTVNCTVYTMSQTWWRTLKLQD